MAITGRLVWLTALGLVPVVVLGQATGEPGLLLGAWLLLVLVLLGIDLAAAASPRKTALERRLPERVRLGEAVDTELLVTNTGGRTLRARVRDGWQPSAGAPGTRPRLSIPAGERRQLLNRLTPTRRGERHVETVTLRSYGPLGLAARQVTLRAPGTLRVLPPFNARKHLPSRLARLRELDGSTSVMVRGAGTEFDSLREYVRGDDVRSIDWRATARRQDVVVRTWRPERDRRIVIVIDTGRTSAARIADEPRIDTAFESSLLLAALASKAGDRVDVLAFDRRVRARIQGATGAALLSRMVDALAPVDPELIETDWASVPGEIRQITNQRALVVLLTTIDAPAASRGLLSMLPQLTRRHRVIVASVTDPEALDSAASRATLEDVYRAAAAERQLLDIERVRTALTQVGAQVVTGSPEDLPPALSDLYLQLKATGQL
jgi:uncharacterized protein (DUF58 family)